MIELLKAIITGRVNMIRIKRQICYIRPVFCHQLPAYLAIFILCFSFLKPFSNAQAVQEIKMRYSQRESVIRIVFEGTDYRQIKKADISSSYTLIKIEFPEDFSFTAPSRVEGFEFNKKDNDIFLNIKDLENIKVVRLNNPPRLVIDARIKKPETLPETQSEKKETPKPSMEKISRAGTILIDPGHGGSDLGLFSPTYREKDLSMKLGRLLRVKLKKRGFRVYLTRGSDRYTTLKKRISSLEKRKPEVLLSLHVTSSNNFIIHTYSPQTQTDDTQYLRQYSQTSFVDESRALAQSIGENLKDKLHADVIYREFPLAILGYCACKAVLIELPTPDFFSYTAQSLTNIADSILEALTVNEKR